MASHSQSSSNDNDAEDSSWLITSQTASFGLEMQQPWSRYLLEGRKTIEVRNYPLPPELIGTKIYIIESKQGMDGVSALGDRIEFHHESDGMNNGGPIINIRGWCKFGSIKMYESKVDFEADEGQHLVSPTSGYAWKEGKTSMLYGWVVQECECFDKASADLFAYGIRRKRSIFQLCKSD